MVTLVRRKGGVELAQPVQVVDLREVARAKARRGWWARLLAWLRGQR